MVALLPSATLIFLLSVVVLFLFPFTYLTLYNLDGLFNEELNISWHYPVVVLLSLIPYLLAGFIYSQLHYARDLDRLEAQALEPDEATVSLSSPLFGSAIVGALTAWVGTLLTFPIWLYLVRQETQLFVIIYDDGLSSLGYYGIMLAGIARLWGLNLLLGGLFGSVFAMLGSFLVPTPALSEIDEWVSDEPE